MLIGSDGVEAACWNVYDEQRRSVFRSAFVLENSFALVPLVPFVSFYQGFFFSLLFFFFLIYSQLFFLFFT